MLANIENSSHPAIPFRPFSTPERFWEMADTTRMAAEYSVDRNLRSLRTLPLENLRRIFTQYRFFTIYYITDLALLISRIPFGQLRSCLGEFLAEELGNGNPLHAHPQLYEDFLRSIGVQENDLNKAAPKGIEILESVRKSLLERSWAYGVGLRGMGGECLCQIYLSSMHENFIHNTAIQEKKNEIEWKFWDIHIGDVDIHHREQTRAAINELISSQPELIEDLAAGYRESKDAWDYFWKGIYDRA